MRAHAAVAIRVAALAAAASAVAAAYPAAADPHDAEIEAVSRCGESCAGPTTAVAEGTLVRDVILIDVRAEADLGLEWVRLEAREAGDPRWYCLEFWNAGRQPAFEDRREWHTRNWTDPSQTCTSETCSSCAENSPHKHGVLTRNLRYELRVVAREQGANVSGNEDDVSQTFALSLANPPAAPEWVGEPAVSGGDEGEPAVTLQWRPNPEDDVVEYRFVRVNEAGEQAAFAVGARDPAAQGCTRIGDVAYRCVDRSFPRDGYGGTYRYGLAAVRSVPKGQACEVTAGSCVSGGLSEARTIAISEPEGAAPTGTSPGGASEPRPGGKKTSTPAGPRPVAASPLPGIEDLGRPSPAPGSSRVPWVIAGALVLAGAAGLAAWRIPGLVRGRDGAA